jgi:hypothetical protein
MAAPILSTMPPVRHSIDLKANGEVSRMRNHKGQSSSRVDLVILLTVALRKYAITPSNQILFTLSSKIHSHDPSQPSPPITFVFLRYATCDVRILIYHIDTNERLHRCNVSYYLYTGESLAHCFCRHATLSSHGATC